MDRYIVQYHSRTLAALADRKKQQTSPLPPWAFNYPKLSNYELKIALSDHLKKTGNINLHTGLNITADMKADSEEEARDVSKNSVETLLNLISFSTLTFCGPARLVSVISALDTSTQDCSFSHYVYPFDEEESLGSLSVMNEPTFGAIFEAYDKSSYKPRTLRALSWLRKGIGEDGSVDEFICYWIGLESIKHVLAPKKKKSWISLEFIKHVLLPTKKTKKKSPDEEWKEVEEIFTNKLHFSNFKKIKHYGRNGLLHGFRQLDNEFVKEIGGYVEPIRKTLIFCIGSALGLEENTILVIANKTPRRIRHNPWDVIKGVIKNIPRNFDELVKNYPVVDAEIANRKFSINDTGEVSITFTVPHHFHGPSGAKWEVKATELWGDRDAGIGHVEVKG
jgi:hypothetical protein